MSEQLTLAESDTSTVDLSWELLTRLAALTRRAGEAILACGRPGHETKADGSPVTIADHAAQTVICEALARWDPGVPIVSEEAPLSELAARRTWRRYWLVDPLDGTKEYLAGRPDYTVNIALIDDGEPIAGVVGAPAMDVIFWAGRGLGAWRQEGDAAPTRLCVRPPDPAQGIRIVESRSHPSPQMEQFLQQVHVVERVQVGSSLKFCRIAEGLADCYPRFGPTMSWDLAAGDCVYRYAAADLRPNRSPLSFPPENVRQTPFIIGPAPGYVLSGERMVAPVDDAGAPVVANTDGEHVAHAATEDASDQTNVAAAAAGSSVAQNIETPLADLLDDSGLTPTRAFYVRSHFATPAIDAAAYRLHVGGLVDRPLRLTLDDLRRMPSETHIVTIECAGNGRGLMEPLPHGEPWTLGAVGTAAWTGVPLGDLLRRCGVRAAARDICFRGADSGIAAEGLPVARFERSLPLHEASADGVLLAWAMNGEPLPAVHGSPLRLIVPGWYGQASVKWLEEIELTDAPSAAFHQQERYWSLPAEPGAAREPVDRQRVRALILEPSAEARVSLAGLVVRGVAWSGAAPIARVEVALGDGPWHDATLTGEAHRFAWRTWEWHADPTIAMTSPGDAPVDAAAAGAARATASSRSAATASPAAAAGAPVSAVSAISASVIIRARATDARGETQPERAAWNALGYGNNAIQRLPVHLA